MSRKNIFNPLTTIKLWTASLSVWNGGRFKSFWFKKNALKWIRENENSFLFIELKNEWTEKEIRIKNNPDKIQAPISIY